MGKNKKNGNTKPTMKEVAQRANVALSTVSHVINGTAPISEETRTRVLEVIEALHYTPNALARGLRQQKTNMIGIIVPDISNEFYARAASFMIREAAADQNTTVLVDTGYSLEREKNSVESLIRNRTDGLIFLGGGRDEELLDYAHEHGVSVVLADRRYKDYCSVEFDNHKAMRELIHVLHDSGYRNVGYISESLDMVNLMDRHEGVLESLKAYGLSINEEWIMNDSWLKLEKVDAAKALMQKFVNDMSKTNMPEVFLASSDMIAVGIMDALTKAGYQVPKDIGVVGYDNITVARYYNPGLTTVEQDCVTFGKEVYSMLKQVMHESVSDHHVLLENRIIRRKSVRLKA